MLRGRLGHSFGLEQGRHFAIVHLAVDANAGIKKRGGAKRAASLRAAGFAASRTTGPAVAPGWERAGAKRFAPVTTRRVCAVASMVARSAADCPSHRKRAA